MPDTPSVRWITPQTAAADAPALLGLFRDLAAFEGWAHLLSVSAAELTTRASAQPPRLQAVLAEAAGTAVGFATVFEIPYAYAVRPSLELEMLYVAEPWRARGVGRLLMTAVLDHARNRECERVEWNVLADNARAQAFYETFGAAEKTGWRRWGVTL